MGTLITDIVQLEAELIDTELINWYGRDFAFDVETSGLDPCKDRLLGLALTFSDYEGSHHSFYIAFEHTIPQDDDTYPTKSLTPRSEAVTRLRSLFSQPDVVMVAHNAKFDLHFLRRAGIVPQGILYDTMLAAHLLDENRPKGLKELAYLVGLEQVHYQELTHYPGFKKDELLGVPLEDAAAYAMRDTETTWTLWSRFNQELSDDGLDAAFARSMALLPVLLDMEARGISLDMGLVREVQEQYRAIRDDAELDVWEAGIATVLVKLGDDLSGWADALGPSHLKPLKDLLPDTDLTGIEKITYAGIELPVLRKPNKAFQPRVPWFNAGSNNHIADLLYQHHGLAIPKDLDLDKAGSKPCVDKDTLKILRFALGEQAPPLLDALLTYRKASKLLSTYLDVYEQRADANDHHCIRTSFNQAVAETGRLSSSQPNLQNQPARGPEGALIRSLFVARPGHKLIVADYAMMELRMAAHFSNDDTMLTAFAEGQDLHSLTAANQTGVTYEAFMGLLAAGDSRAKAARFIGKTSNFGLLYGMGAKKFRLYLLVNNGVLVTPDEAQALIQGFNRTFAGVQTWKRQIMQFAHHHQFVYTIAERKRRLPGLVSPQHWQQAEAERQAVNAVVQGSCADIMIEVMPPIQAAMTALGGSLLLTVHDELVAEVPEESAQTAATLMSTLMADLPNERHCLVCPLVVEAHVGDSWGDAKG
jgi:DNA polymerase I